MMPGPLCLLWGGAALNKSARCFQLWQWLKIAPIEETPFYAATSANAKADDFNDKDQGLPFMAEFENRLRKGKVHMRFSDLSHPIFGPS